MGRRQQRNKCLNDVFPNWASSGIFELLESFDVPWKTYVSGDVIDLDYHGNKSGRKLISPLVKAMLDSNGDLPAAQQTKLAGLLFYKYGEGWKRAWDALQATYNPIHNYSSTEVRTPNLLEVERPDLTEVETPDLTETRTPDLTETRTPDLTDTYTPTVKDTEKTKENHKEQVDEALYGFNSSTAVPSSTTTKEGTDLNNDSERTLEHEGYDTTAHTGTDTKTTTGTDTNTKTGTNTKTKTGSTTKESLGSETTTRDGNIGTTKTQEMIEDELTLRFDTNYFERVYKNIDDILTINIFKN